MFTYKNTFVALLSAITFKVVLCVSFAQATEIISKEELKFWRDNAPKCDSGNDQFFPSKKDSIGNCDDGDITLFAGLLCASGEDVGCETVKNSQDSDGRWFRSPRRKNTNNLNAPNSFSPDMALGAQLYTITRKDSPSQKKWLAWIDKSRPCWVGSGESCFRGPVLRFCTDDTEKGCTVKPKDAGILSLVNKSLGVSFDNKDLNDLINQQSINLFDLIFVNSQVNDSGYPRHLVGTSVYLLRLAGYNSPKLDAAAVTLASKNPENPFFLYLAGKEKSVVASTLRKFCPSTNSSIPKEKVEWAWERDESDQAWTRSMLWDCIFIGNLLNNY